MHVAWMKFPQFMMIKKQTNKQKMFTFTHSLQCGGCKCILKLLNGVTFHSYF